MPVSRNDFTEWKQFHVGDILTIITGVLVSPRGIKGVYDILGWMLDEQLMTHQLIRASKQCEPILKDLYPGMAALEVPDSSKVSEDLQPMFWQQWLGTQVRFFGEELPVPRVLNHTPPDPIKEFVEVMKKYDMEPIIVVAADPEEAANAIQDILKKE